MARIHYRRVPSPLPKLSLVGLAYYWKKYYNTVKGKGSVNEFRHNFSRFVGDVPEADNFYPAGD